MSLITKKKSFGFLINWLRKAVLDGDEMYLMRDDDQLIICFSIEQMSLSQNCFNYYEDNSVWIYKDFKWIVYQGTNNGKIYWR